MSTPSPEFWMLPCVECEQPMKGRGQRISFEGDWSIHEFRFECQSTACQASAVVIYRTFIPIDVARGRDAAGGEQS